jgi:alpha-1,6-mannosyltransferase
MSLLAVVTAAGPSAAVAEARAHFFPAWLAGPLRGSGLRASALELQLLVATICASYLLILRHAAAISSRRLWWAIVSAHLAALLAPPLFSGDVFGYIGFARLVVLHGLSPYVHAPSAAPHDAIFHLLGWPTLTTPYGPLFTLATEALVPLGIAGGLWALKSVAALASLATVALIWRTAPRFGRSPRAAAAFYGLNPLVLVFAVAGAHNETLIGLLIVAGALAIVTGHERRGGVALVAACAVKASAALTIPFALLGARRRGRAGAAIALSLVGVAAVAVIAFGPHLFGLAGALLTQQEKVAGHSVPAEISQLLGLGQLSGAVRGVLLALFAVVLITTLWRTRRGADWLTSYGWSTLALLAATVWLVPWYGLWALLPASLSASGRLRVVTLVAFLYLIATHLLVHNALSAG